MLISNIYVTNIHYSGLPSPPSLNITGDTVCFWSTSIFPVDYYDIKIIDLTGAHEDQILNESSTNTSESCLSLTEALFPPECSPYDVFVRAHNRVGNSNTSIITMQGTKIE